MSKYSEMAGSFIRMGNFPLEANYIFPDEATLKAFYKEDINRATLHKGLLKIVEFNENGKQALFWVTDINGQLQFTELISGDSISDILTDLSELEKKLNTEIQDRKDEDTAIWGTEDRTELPEGLDNLAALAEQVNLFKLVFDKLDQICKFLEERDPDDELINTLPEILDFLEGFTDKDKLYDILKDLWNIIEGTPTPSLLFLTLRGLQNFVETLASVVKNRCDNLQTELDLTLVGVGLSGDGGFSPDLETYYLKNATSVMNALKTLDALINWLINNVTIEGGETETATIDVVKEDNKTTIYAKVKTSEQSNNDIIVNTDGLYHNIDSEYANGILTIKVNGQVRQTHVLGLSSIVENAYYDTATENIVIIFKLQTGGTQTVLIPAADLITEWEVDNNNSTVELTRVRVEGGGPDKLSANVKLSSDEHNLLKKDGDSLIVDGRVIDELKEEISKTGSDLAESIYYYHAAATITASPTLIEKGVNTTVNITATSSFKTDGAKTLTIKNVTASKDLTGSGTTARMTATDSISDTTTFQAVAAFNYNVTKTANVTVTAKYPCYSFGSTSNTITSADVIAGTKAVKSSAAGSYAFTLTLNLTYFWICVPSEMSVNKVTLSGFDVPMEAPVTIAVDGKGNYKCYRSTNSNDAGSYTLVVS